MATPDKKRDGAAQFTEADCLWNQFVAHLRIHVERAIRHVLQFQVFSTRWPLNRKDLMSSIMFAFMMLCNYRRPVGGVDFGL
eukprot:1594061-Pleurochrysis_carterae.AAC.1